MSLVSVIVPNYNHAPYLRQRLDSIYNQTFQDFEVIILDDCSTDNSKEIIEEYRNYPQTSHIVYNEVNSGSPFKQWAKGFDLAQGEYIWIAESDDWAELNFLEQMVPNLNKDISLAFIFCESYWEEPQKTVKGCFAPKNTFFDGLDFIRQKQIYNNNIVNASSVLFRKIFLPKISLDYQSFIGSGDYLFWSNLCEHGNVFYVKKHLNHFRRNSTTTTNKCLTTGKVFLENFQIYEYFKSKGYISTFANYRIVDYTLNQIKKFKDELIKNKRYDQCCSLWDKELKLNGFQSHILLFLAQQINKYSNIPLYAKIWKFFHLPNTNIRDRFLGKH